MEDSKTDCECHEIIDDCLNIEQECSHFTGDIKHFEGVKLLYIHSDYEQQRPSIENFRIPDSLTEIYHEEPWGPVKYVPRHYSDHQIEQFFLNNGYYNLVDVTEYSEPTEIKINGHVYRRRCINLNWLFENLSGWDWNLNILIDNYLGFAQYKFYCNNRLNGDGKQRYVVYSDNMDEKIPI